MKKSIIAFALLAGCAVIFAKPKAAVSADQNKSDCAFAFGADASAYFTGTVYMRNLIPLDDTYRFPETNLITFAPGARSGWHRHGGIQGVAQRVRGVI